MRLAVIPARGGSKRIPRKNVKCFHGKPMIAWAIEAAKASGLFDHIIVSTDDQEIADISTLWGAEVPFMRPTELSNDHAGTGAVIAHTVRWAQNQDWDITAACCIYATAPFLQISDLLHACHVLENSTWDYVFTATDFAAPIFRSFKQNSDGGLEMFFPDEYMTRSQDLPTALHDAGQFYWGTPEAWLEERRVFHHKSFPIIIPRWRVQDIDTPQDWIRAEMIAPILLQSFQNSSPTVKT
ncbi:MAG: pseudaminic acid cytidylyltransferase [Acidobacteriota bacterium]